MEENQCEAGVQKAWQRFEACLFLADGWCCIVLQMHSQMRGATCHVVSKTLLI